ncbi:DNA topoisomerase IB [Candidatus Binatus sp.]|uniref:DNA topoisomerase IB n=1 Tax=Candidatus Binatus sp. TaxID=2811406 RepID=UPI003C40FCE2
MSAALAPLNGSSPDPEAILAAKSAKLRYVSDQDAGIVRARQHGRFVYRDSAGKEITDAAVLDRIKALAIPPAWTNVWICASADGHLQATGRDARRRKQYRYHARWRAVRDENKYEHLLDFARSLPAIRRRVQHDLSRPDLPREKVLAAVVRLMERTLARVGNAEYARENQSFGLTTLQNRHVTIKRDKITLDFRAKSGVQCRRVVSDKKLARILKHCRDLPGSELFQYLDENGDRHSIDSSDVNDYLRNASGRDITAKDFRTWAGTNLAIVAFCALKEEKPTKKSELEVVRSVAQQLGNTVAVCRKCYIHPAVISSYHGGSLRAVVASVSQRTAGISAVEKRVQRLLAYSTNPFSFARCHARRSVRNSRRRAESR